MRIGNYVSVVSGQRGFENNVSGHIQVPLHGMGLLRDAGHEVHLITNRFGEERTLPNCLPKGVPVHLVDDARSRGGILERTGGQASGVRAGTLLRQVSQIKRIAREQRFDVLHFHGFNRTAYLAGGLRLAGLRCPTVATVFGANLPQELPRRVARVLWGRVGAVLTATEHVRRAFAEEGVAVEIVRHGVIRDLTAEARGQAIGPRRRVLFWRDPSVENGADIVAAAYESLAPRYPDISFDMAVRPHWSEIPGLDDLPKRHPNVHVHRFPYKDGVTLPGLMLESLCVLMPIREMSIDPQLVIAESLATGVTVIATDQRSNRELIDHGKTGLLVPLGDAEATTGALDSLLRDREKTLEMGRLAAADIAARWNWSNYVSDTVAVYERVVGRRSAARA